MATPKKDWKSEWEAISKESRTLAKRANQRMVRLERYSQREGLSEITKYAYQKAQQYIKTNLGGSRYKEHVKLYDINDGSKELKGEALYKANVMIQRQRIKAMNEVLVWSQHGKQSITNSLHKKKRDYFLFIQQGPCAQETR